MRSITGQRIPQNLRDEAVRIKDTMDKIGIRISLNDAYNIICNNFKINGRDKISFFTERVKKKNKVVKFSSKELGYCYNEL